MTDDELRAGLVALVANRDLPIPTHERVSAAFLLGELGDPRMPVTAEAWRREVERTLSGDASGYFCRVEPGTYWIGCGDDDPDAPEEEQPRHQVSFAAPFYIARYPITNAQWAAWGEEQSKRADDTDLNRPNQPAVSLDWAWCHRFCAWLSEQTGASIRLPTEQEWEAAARGGDTRRYPWGDEWREDCAATEENRKTRGWSWSVPVGCYPAGAAPCGAMDMAGNVWEWTASVWQSYPGAAESFTDANQGVLRGGYYDIGRTYARCGAREQWFLMCSVSDLSYGLRVVLAPPLASMS